MSHQIARVEFAGRLVILGFGSVGLGVLPLLLRHVVSPRQVTIVTETRDKADVAAEFGVEHFISAFVTRENYESVLGPLLGPGDFLLNSAYEVSSIALIDLCRRAGALYLDTNIEPWHGWFDDKSLAPSRRSNYALREMALAARKARAAGPTAVLAHGANPGLVSHFVKQALLDLARDAGMAAVPRSRREWAELARRLNVKTMHVAERDTQVSNTPKRKDEFVNTWSIGGLVAELLQFAELGWGSHERHFPAEAAHHEFGSQCAIYFDRPGALVWVRSWTPQEGSYYGFLTAHQDSISISDFLSVGQGRHSAYRPTVHYAYHPCDAAVMSIWELAGKNWLVQKQQRVMMEEIESGDDELGVLLMGHERGAYWYGSRLSIGAARRLAPHNNATSLQVTAGVLAGAIWAIENPQAGIVEPEDIDSARVLEICAPYLGELRGVYTGWTPLEGRGALFDEDLDLADPWQFKNFRVA